MRLLVALFGPTASGKTVLACSVADRIRARLISCDAFQGYCGLDAATAKPSGRELRHPWALVDWLSPHVDLNLGDWARAAEKEVAHAFEEERVPIIVGGTGLYLRGLLKGVAQAPVREEGLRRRLRRLAERRSVGFLHRVLRRLDPVSAARIGARDRQRLVRALEVRLVSGEPLSSMQGRGWSGPDRYPTLRIGLDLPREVLDERIDRRVETFLEAGLVDEVRTLIEREGVAPSANALRAIGYRETVAWLAAEAAGEQRFDLAARIQRNTRRYARKQLTWFRRETDAVWIDPREDDAALRIVDLIRARSSGPASV